MVSRWPIRRKLQLCVGLLLVAVTILSFSGFQGVYAFRGLAKSIGRSDVSAIATRLALRVSDLRHEFQLFQERHRLTDFVESTPDRQVNRTLFQSRLDDVWHEADQYKERLISSRESELSLGDGQSELGTINEIIRLLNHVKTVDRDSDWILGEVNADELQLSLEQLSALATKLPTFLQKRLQGYARDVRLKYRTWIVLAWVTSATAGLLLLLQIRLFYAWVFKPLRVLITGSRRVACGDFGHRIELQSRDEIAELADAMNAMTKRFQEIRNDLDDQVQQRTKEVVRNEQLASVGFLAAGVAHEINNPLASIAFCAESLEDRLRDIIQESDVEDQDEQHSETTVLRNYLRMIQDEAFRCKEITSQLLDFSRLGDVERERTDLTMLVQGVIDMVGHLGNYKGKSITFRPVAPIHASVNPQEIKQVVLNLITNSLDCVDSDGTVEVTLTPRPSTAELVVRDNGCGMTEEVQTHLFEPFFTRRRDGQGTGLGLSISYRIVIDHGGQIDAHSDGPNCGSTFRVVFPLTENQNESTKRREAA